MSQNLTAGVSRLTESEDAPRDGVRGLVLFRASR